MMSKMQSRWLLPTAIVALTVSMASGCKTTGDKDEDKGLVPAARIVFRPGIRKVPVQAGEGSYPNLFTGASYAIWGGGEAMATRMLDDEAPPMMVDDATDAMMAKKDTADPAKKASDTDSKSMGEKETLEDSSDMMAAPSLEAEKKMAEPMMVAANGGGPVVVTCYLESQFSDMSVAYDVVGLRGIQLQLELPDGSHIPPVQKELDSELVEVPVGALRRFGRKITLYFPGNAIMVDNPAVTPGSRGVRLVLEGHNTQFFFEWPTLPENTATVKGPRWSDDALQVTKASYRGLATRAKKISHEFE